jgi:hypothetical protein
MTQVRSVSATGVDAETLHPQVGERIGSVDRRSGSVLGPMLVGILAHVDLLEVAEQARGGEGMREAQSSPLAEDQRQSGV